MRAPRWFMSNTVRLAAVVALLGGALTLGNADAATPPEGDCLRRSPQASWAGGPFVAPNATGNALDQPDCTAPPSCDDFTLHVDTPAGYGSHAHADDQGGLGEHGRRLRRLRARQGRQRRRHRRLERRPGAGRPAADRRRLHRARGALRPARRVVRRDRDPGHHAGRTRRPARDTPPASPTTRRRARCPDANNAGEPSIGTSFKTGATMFQSYLSTYKVDFDDSVIAGEGDLDRRLRQRRQRLPAGQHDEPRPDPVHRPRDRPHLRVAADRRRLAHLLHRRRRHDLEPQHRRRHPLAASTTRPSAAAPTPPTGSARCRPSTTRTPSTTAARTSPPRSARPRATAARRSAPASRRTACSTAAACTATSRSRPDGTAYLPTRAAATTRPRSSPPTTASVDRLARCPARRPATPTRRSASARNGTVYFGYVGADGKPGHRGQPRPRQDLDRPADRRHRASASRTRCSRPWSPVTTTAPRSPTSAPRPAATTRTTRTSTASGTSTSTPPTTAARPG